MCLYVCSALRCPRKMLGWILFSRVNEGARWVLDLLVVVLLLQGRAWGWPLASSRQPLWYVHRFPGLTSSPADGPAGVWPVSSPSSVDWKRPAPSLEFCCMRRGIRRSRSPGRASCSLPLQCSYRAAPGRETGTCRRQMLIHHPQPLLPLPQGRRQGSGEP